jgi:hypothetical protein
MYITDIVMVNYDKYDVVSRISAQLEIMHINGSPNYVIHNLLVSHILRMEAFGEN